MNSNHSRWVLDEDQRPVRACILIVVLVYAGIISEPFEPSFFLGTEYPLAVVEGNSMNPTYLDGDLLVLQGVPSETIIVDVVIVFHSPNEYDKFIVHRVKERIETNGRSAFTKGNNNWTVDPWRVPTQNVVGIVLYRIPAVAPGGDCCWRCRALLGA